MNKKLTKEENLKLVLEKKIEKVLFNEDELLKLKNLTDKVSIGTTPAKTLREFIVDFRGDVIEKLLKKLLRIFKFYAHQVSTQDQLSGYTSGNNSQITQDLQEKNELLEKVADKIGYICEKVKKTVDISV